MKVGLFYISLAIVLLATPQDKFSGATAWVINIASEFWVATVLAILIAATIEATFLLGLALPGSFIIIVAVVISAENGVSPLLVCGAGIVGTSCGYAVSMFVIGPRSRVGNASARRLRIENWPVSPLTLAFFSTALPQFAGMVAYSIGSRGHQLLSYFLSMLVGTSVFVVLVYIAVVWLGSWVIDAAAEGKNYFSLVMLLFGLIELLLARKPMTR